MKSKAVVYSAVIAAMYIVLTFISNAFGLASGVIQVRISEALTILPFFTPYAIPGLFVGCLLSNILTGCMFWDIVFGSIATLLGAIFTYYVGKIKSPRACFLAPLGAIISNTFIVPPILRYVYGLKDAYIFMSFTVCIGEIISAGIFGMILFFALKKHTKRFL